MHYLDHAAIDERLRSKGFTNNTQFGVICRYCVQGIIVDVMPTEENAWFSNIWYQQGYTTAAEQKPIKLPKKYTHQLNFKNITMNIEEVDYGDAIQKIADLITSGNIHEAQQVAKSMPRRIKRKKIENSKYNSYSGKKNDARKYSKLDLMQCFIEDGFFDRYTNLRVVIPPALRVISEILPIEFPII